MPYGIIPQSLPDLGLVNAQETETKQHNEFITRLIRELKLIDQHIEFWAILSSETSEIKAERQSQHY